MTTLKELGFINATDRPIFPRLIIGISGMDKQGKTHFGLTAPGPIAMISTDIGEEGVVNKFTDKKIVINDVGNTTDLTPETAIDEWDRFKDMYIGLLQMPKTEVSTILWDTASELWELIRMARFGKLEQVQAFRYGQVNTEFENLIKVAYSYDKNLILTHRRKALYVNDKRTNETRISGYNGTNNAVQINMQAIRKPIDQGGEFTINIENCRHDPNLAGFTLENPLNNFPGIAKLLFPGTEDKDWE